MKNPSKFNLLLNAELKTITLSVVCLFYILNTQAANYNDLKLELETAVIFASVKEIKNENPNFTNTSINPVEKNTKKLPLIEIPDYFENHFISQEKSSFTSTHSISKTNKSVIRKALSNTATTNSNQKDALYLGSELTLDLLAEKKRKAAFNPTTVYTHSEKIGKLKLKAKLKSIKLTVYF